MSGQNSLLSTIDVILSIDDVTCCWEIPMQRLVGQLHPRLSVDIIRHGHQSPTTPAA
jgi:hypothetical protein